MILLLAQALSLLWTFVWSVSRALFAVPGILVSWVHRTIARPNIPPDWRNATFWEGTVYHLRKRPARNEFRYPVRVAFINLGDPPRWFDSQRQHHLTCEEAQRLAASSGQVWLLTNPISAGYIQNPISVYYCYDGKGGLKSCIAEVTNTPWGERVTFLFDPSGQVVPKALHVSPMMDMQNDWFLQSSDPRREDCLKLIVNAAHPEHGAYFQASLVARLSNMPHHPNERASLPLMLRYAFQPHRIAGWIYLQAIVLLLKGVPLYGVPDKSYQAGMQSRPNVSAVPRMPCGSAFLWQEAPRWPWR